MSQSTYCICSLIDPSYVIVLSVVDGESGLSNAGDDRLCAGRRERVRRRGQIHVGRLRVDAGTSGPDAS